MYGPNGSGKSSIMYALLTLKNIILNPNQQTASFFNYSFANLGGYNSVVFDHKPTEEIELSLEASTPEGKIIYKIAFSESKGKVFIRLSDTKNETITGELQVQFPYPLSQQVKLSGTVDGKPIDIIWNGFLANASSTITDPRFRDLVMSHVSALNYPSELLKGIAFVSIKRGFSKPAYSSVPLSPLLMSEDEIASILANNKYLVSKVSHYLEKIAGREFRINYTPGTAIFTLDSTDRSTGEATELVNDGFGTNQLVYLLAKILHPEAKLVCIEEPEIHLHPSALRAFAEQLVDIAKDEDKTFMISTHSESLIASFLGLVARGVIDREKIACYYVSKGKKSSNLERQEVNEKGQIQGGLSTFVQEELKDLASFLKSE